MRNVIGGQADDPRRVYRLSVRREEPDFSVAAIPRLSDSAGLNIPRGGRAIVDVIAVRRRGQSGAIRVSAQNAPDGIECPDVWLGPGVDHTTLVVSADQNAPPFAGQLRLNASTETIDRRAVRGGAIVPTGTPNGWGRITSEVPLSVAGDAPLRITANGHEPRGHHLYGDLQVRHAPGGILDVAVQVERRDRGHQAPVKLIGVGVPELIANETTTIPAGKDKGYISFYLPPNLPVGQYSLGVRGVTSVGENITGTIQIIANEDAPLGEQPFLRLYGVGTLEDEAVFHGSCFLKLEVIE